MKYIYCFLLLLFFGLASAQAPGYLGKKTFIEYDLFYMLAIGGPTVNNNTFSFDNLAISTRHNFQLNHVVSRSGVLGISFDFLKTGIQIDYIDDEDNIQTNFSTLKVNAIGLQYDKYFMKLGSLAPIGFYHHFEVKLISARPLALPFNEVVQRTTYTGYGIGMKKVFKNRFFINFSGQVGWTWGDRSFNRSRDDFKRNIQKQINLRLYSNYIFENNFGIGILLF